ncbi:hypothetical protein [Alteraurantiacibacter buctensis]|uniref:Cell wall polymerase n=1 Tax=Alteraurantiacibacter buctensis TaxID=1503981 RepID=A0A844YWT4_9SPHN|nr:hypothetical protein [Alteraurantiacibacter buctensis]MXO71428.1 hypothetical protein [Alteraurantiacibacter buctensis]
MPVRARLHHCAPALLALGLPVLAGVACLVALGAPASYWQVNLGALVLVCGLIALLPPLTGKRNRLLAGVLLALLLLAAVIGPEYNGVQRWLALGPLRLNAGFLAIPALAVLAARMPGRGPHLLAAALIAALLMPDAGAGAAITFAAVGLHQVTRDFRMGLLVIAGFMLSLWMAVNGELPPAPFVEQVTTQYAAAGLAWPSVVLLALALGFALLLFTLPLEAPARYALAGSLFGFAMMALMNTYPFPLVAYGAGPILGYGLALALHRSPAP